MAPPQPGQSAFVMPVFFRLASMLLWSQVMATGIISSFILFCQKLAAYAQSILPSEKKFDALALLNT
jgi:hypothetical protein